VLVPKARPKTIESKRKPKSLTPRPVPGFTPRHAQRRDRPRTSKTGAGAGFSKPGRRPEKSRKPAR
jgi:hypothetical protein